MTSVARSRAPHPPRVALLLDLRSTHTHTRTRTHTRTHAHTHTHKTHRVTHTHSHTPQPYRHRHTRARARARTAEPASACARSQPPKPAALKLLLCGTRKTVRLLNVGGGSVCIVPLLSPAITDYHRLSPAISGLRSEAPLEPIPTH